MESLKKITFKDYSNVARMEYLPAEAPAIFIPLLITVTVLTDLLNPLYYEAILAFTLLYFSGFIINSYTDVTVDKHYKIYVATSSEKMGPKVLQYLVVLQVGIAIILIIHIAWSIKFLALIPISLLGIFMGLAYSVKPFEFKVKGILHIISLSLSAFMVPFVLLYSTMSMDFSWYILILFLGFTIAHYGIALANQTGDFLEDRSEKLQTPAVRWGLNNTLKLAKTMSLVGLGMELFAFYILILYAPWLPNLEAVLAITLPIPARYLLFMLVTVFTIVGYSVALRGLFSIHHISKLDISIVKRMKMIKGRMNYPIWQASAIWGLVATALTIMISTVFVGA